MLKLFQLLLLGIVAAGPITIQIKNPQRYLFPDSLTIGLAKATLSKIEKDIVESKLTKWKKDFFDVRDFRYEHEDLGDFIDSSFRKVRRTSFGSQPVSDELLLGGEISTFMEYIISMAKMASKNNHDIWAKVVLYENPRVLITRQPSKSNFRLELGAIRVQIALQTEFSSIVANDFESLDSPPRAGDKSPELRYQFVYSQNNNLKEELIPNPRTKKRFICCTIS